jgi:DNA-binding LytR/AlgR family response regulator
MDMASYRCVAIDDEYPATQIIKAYIDKIPNVELVKSYTNALEGMQYLISHEVDIVFLDIQMPDINGLDISRNLSHPPKIIFTTAYDQYALEGFDVAAVDYLLKPFSFERFNKAVNKALHLIELENKAVVSIDSTPETITLKSDYKLHKVNLDDIDYIEGLKAYVSFFIKGKRLITLASLKDLEEKLPSDRFMRVHKSFIVPIHKVKALHGNLLEMESKEIPIGKSYKEVVIERIFKAL